MAKMELETTAKRVENKDWFVNQYNYDTFSVSRLQLCFTRGVKFIKLFYMENGLQIASKKFDEIEKIYVLEFIDSDEKLLIIGSSPEGLKLLIWDMYNTGEIETTMILDDFLKIENLGSRLARTSGNILQVDDDGKVTSILKRVNNKLSKQKQKKKEEKKLKLDKFAVPNVEKFEGIKPNGDSDKSHTIYFDKNMNPTFKPIVTEKEPWVLGDYERISYCLYHNKKGTETETLQLIVNRSTVQIWHKISDETKQKEYLPNKGEPFLEYIWTNRIPVNQEREQTRLRIEEFKYGLNDGRLNDFYLKVYWYERIRNKKIKDNDEENAIKDENTAIYNIEKNRTKLEENEHVERWDKVIERKNITEKFHAVRHAVKALEHLNKRYKNKYLVDSYNRVHKYEEMLVYIKHIVWRFAKYDPENFNLLDIRYNFMKSLILGDCDHLVKFILFGDEGNIENNYANREMDTEKEKKEKEKRQKMFEVRHIPRNILWPGEDFLKDDDLDLDRFDRKDDRIKDNEVIKPGNNMELAIYHCKGREHKDTCMVGYLLEYYSRHATDCAGWMITVSKAIPLLFKYNYDDYARKLFFKECFADQDHFSAQNSHEIIPVKYLARRNHNIKFRAFRPIIKLKSDKYEWHYKVLSSLKSSKNNMFKFFEDFDNDLGKSPLALRVVPLPSFTINSIPNKKVEYNYKKIILNILWFIFLPRWYEISRKERNKLSPFSRMILYENNDNIYDNPATEAVIDFRWQEARNFFFFLFLRFFIFAICFVLVSWAYLDQKAIPNTNFLFASIVIFYYLAIYQLITEALQLHYRGPKKYFDEIFNSFDIISIVISVIVMSIMLKNFRLSDGFGSVEAVDTGLIAGISFSIFILWIELILYLRLISNIGIYIYYVIIIFKTIYPFLLFMLTVLFAFAHTMFVLLKKSKEH
ncbi:hypothetical protein C1645_340202 [Glomus cerebriforme]|uniref:Ion transport domain-containing protein n=1 Tax=Glomus cerebriforme TaxID=658196 RepID=A0A397SNW5_9GLOM|nr:hypothetical protein C1645_340202 [Glomus cerebriforme]